MNIMKWEEQQNEKNEHFQAKKMKEKQWETKKNTTYTFDMNNKTENNASLFIAHSFSVCVCVCFSFGKKLSNFVSIHSLIRSLSVVSRHTEIICKCWNFTTELPVWLRGKVFNKMKTTFTLKSANVWLTNGFMNKM